MFALSLFLMLSVLAAFPGAGNAGAGPPETMHSDGEEFHSINPDREMYRGYFFDLSEIAGQQDFATIADALRRQVDIVESVGLSQRVLKFFHTVPIVVDEMACLSSEDPKVLASGCYSRSAPQRSQRTFRPATVWDSKKSQWTNSDPVALAETTTGVVMIRPLRPFTINAQNPTILHEMLHAYHGNMLPQGVKNPTVLLHYNLAKSGQLYPANSYLLTNEKEFFAVTASVLLYGKAHELTRSNLKEKQPDYFKYLVWLFGFDPDRMPSASPIASAF